MQIDLGLGYLETVLLMGISSFFITMIVTAIEVFDKYDEFIFVKKIHVYPNTEFIAGIVAGVIFFTVFIGSPFVAEYVMSLPPEIPLDRDYSQESFTLGKLIKDYVNPIINGHW